MRRALALLACATTIATACSAGGGGHDLTVLAASSLSGAFSKIGSEFEAAHPGVTVDFSFGPSDGLATQIEQGSPTDVFASASSAWMQSVQAHVSVLDEGTFAQNRLVVITPAGDPAGVHSVADLARPGVKLVMAAPGVPAGDYGRQVLANAGVEKAAEANIVSNETDDQAVLEKVLLGEADAGIVYATDVTPTVAPKLTVVQIPAGLNVLATYPIAVVKGSANQTLAAEFVDFVRGTQGQAVLRSFGFLPPP